MTLNEITGYQAVREAARDHHAYSSDLQGDRDVRTYRQLPLEIDPPAHHAYRSVIGKLFMKRNVDPLVPQFTEVAQAELTRFIAAGGGDVVSELALPVVVGCLGVLYKRPQDVAEWLSWGPDVWRTPDGRSGDRLNSYLPRVFDEAEQSPSDDMWTFISRMEVNGERISREEMYGIASVLLAGGRDTVVKLMTGMIWHLGINTADREYLRANPDETSHAIAELLRFLSPLPRMERVPREYVALLDAERDLSTYVHLSFVSANHDPSMFVSPQTIDIHRDNTSHLAFGAGPHTCVGSYVAEVETKVLIEQLLALVPEWTVEPSSVLRWAPIGNSRYIDSFESLIVSFD